jgi:hypothetical protein
VAPISSATDAYWYSGRTALFSRLNPELLMPVLTVVARGGRPLASVSGECRSVEVACSQCRQNRGLRRHRRLLRSRRGRRYTVFERTGVETCEGNPAPNLGTAP